MLDEFEDISIVVMGAREQRLPPGLGGRIDGRSNQMGLEDGPRHFALTAARLPGFAGQPPAHLRRHADRQDLRDGRHGVYSIHPGTAGLLRQQ